MANGIETGTRPVNFRKVGIVGCGFVGSASAFALMQSGLFSEMVLIDVDRDRAEGEALDIAHGMPLASPANIYAGDYADIADAGIVIITAGANQKPGETRLDLVSKNVSIFKSIVPQITHSGFDGILLVVSNPVDILTYVALKLSGLPANRVIGSGTVLDTARFKYVLGEHLGVDPRNVHARIVGEHGDEIIEKKHATYYGIAMSVKRICEAIVRDEKPILPVSNLMEGEYGISDIALSMPAVVGAEGIEYKVPAPFSDDEQARLRESAEVLKSVIEKLDL